MSRQNYYARRRERQRRQVDGQLVAGLVQRERRLQPRLGTRKLYHLLKPELEQANRGEGQRLITNASLTAEVQRPQRRKC